MMTSFYFPGVVSTRVGFVTTAIIGSFKQDRWLIAFALSVLAVAYLLVPTTGVPPDYEFFGYFLSKIFTLLALGWAVAVATHLIRLAFVDKSKTPARDLAKHTQGFVTEGDRMAVFFSTLCFYFLFVAGYAVLKIGIPAINPFSWDMAFVNLDRALHLGSLPHEWLMPLLGGEAGLFGLNIMYNLWYALTVASMVAAGLIVKNPLLRQQYIASFLLVYFTGGFLAATLFSSAGPCFHAPLGLGDTYAGLMAALHGASEVYPIWALDIQERLWTGYSGEHGAGGIAAFPSMHVATSVLMALGAYRINRTFGYVMWAYAVVVMIGSVMLAWHYAVDGYASVLLTLAVWKVGGLYAKCVVNGECVAGLEAADEVVAAQAA